MDAEWGTEWTKGDVFFHSAGKTKKPTFEPKSEVMITFEEAQEITLGQAVSFGVEEISFREVPGRVLAAGITADADIPPFDKSAMDGFACRRADLGNPMRVVEVIRAGFPPQKPIATGECAQIMTGAALPEGADVVIKVEMTEVAEGAETMIVFKGDRTSANICYRGEDRKAGELILPAGMLLGARHVPILATVGAVRVMVARSPSVGTLSTGTELVEPAAVPGISQIRNTNAYQMLAQLGAMGINADYCGIAPDDPEQTRRMIGEALEADDLVILSGGISMGEYDFVPSVLKSLGIRILFSQVAIQPGKPTLFGTKKGKFVFGLPGNPVSSYFTLELLVKPFIYECMGHRWNPSLLRLPAGKAITRRKSHRMSWIPVRLTGDGKIIPVEYHGSAHILALSEAFGVVAMPIGQTEIKEGDWVNVQLL